MLLAMQEEHAGRIAGQPGNAARRNILVAEDDGAMRDFLRLYLRNAGYAVTLAEDAPVAGRKLLDSHPDLIISDMNLPYMIGSQLAAILIAATTVAHVPILLITSHEQC